MKKKTTAKKRKSTKRKVTVTDDVGARLRSLMGKAMALCNENGDHSMVGVVFNRREMSSGKAGIEMAIACSTQEIALASQYVSAAANDIISKARHSVDIKTGTRSREPDSASVN
jgi:hypothetical protein